jgi:hypothetical protein
MLAMRKITQVLALAPDHAEALALKATAAKALATQREAAFVLAAIRNARSRFANGKHQAALQLLENLDSSAHPIVAETLSELRAALREIQERRRAEEEAARSSVATVLILPPSTEPELPPTMVAIPAGGPDGDAPRTDEVHRPGLTPAARGVEDEAREYTVVDLKTSGGFRQAEAEATARPWRWAVIAGVAVLLLAILLALLRL